MNKSQLNKKIIKCDFPQRKSLDEYVKDYISSLNSKDKGVWARYFLREEDIYKKLI